MKKGIEILQGVAIWLCDHQAFGWIWIIAISLCMVGTIGVGFACSNTEKEMHEIRLEKDTIEMRLDRIEMKQDMLYDLIIRKFGD